MKLWYLGPKVNVSLPFALNGQKRLLTIMAAFFFSISGFSQELVFRNPQLESGINESDGAVYRFRNVATNIDALLKINRRSSDRVRLKEVDYNGSGWDRSFQPKVEYNNGQVNGTVNWWMEFEMSFVNKNATTPVNVQSFDITALDVDGDGQNLREFITFYKPKSYTLETPTLLTVTSISDLLTGLLTGGYKFLGPTNNYQNIDTGTTNVMATLKYTNTNKITFRIGGERSGGGGSDAGDRMNSLWFKSFNYSAPVTTLPVKLVSFNASVRSKAVTLSWTTSMEKNVSHYTIQRSNTGAEYDDAGMILTGGNSESLKSYSFKDFQTGNGSVLYYRLKIVDIDGKTEYSPVRMVRLNGAEKQAQLLVFPNPVVNEVRITIPESWQNKKVVYELFDMSGVLLKRVVNNSASQTETFNMLTYNKGSYVMKASTEEEMMVERLIKK